MKTASEHLAKISVSDLTDTDREELRRVRNHIQRELDRRQAEELERLEKINKAYAKDIFSKLPILLPLTSHINNSCTDNGMENAFSYEKSTPKCMRCFILGAIDSEYWPSEMKLIISAE